VHTLLAHQIEQRVGELAVAAAAHYEQVGAVGGVQQYLHRMTAGDLRVHGHAMAG